MYAMYYYFKEILYYYIINYVTSELFVTVLTNPECSNAIRLNEQLYTCTQDLLHGFFLFVG